MLRELRARLAGPQGNGFLRRVSLVEGELLLREDQYAKSIEALAKALEPFADITELEGELLAGAASTMQGDLDGADRRFQQSLEIASRLGRLDRMAGVRNSLGANAERRSEYELAQQHFRESVTLARRTSDRTTEIKALANLTMVSTNGGRLGYALNTAEETLDMAVLTRRRRLEGLTRFNRGYVLRRIGALDEAASELERAKELRAEAGDEQGALLAAFNLKALGCERGESLDFDSLSTYIEALARFHTPTFVASMYLEMGLICDDPAWTLQLLEAVEDLPKTPHQAWVLRYARHRLAVAMGYASHNSLTTLVNESGEWLELAEAVALLTTLVPDDTQVKARFAQVLQLQTEGLPRKYGGLRERYVLGRACRILGGGAS